MSQSETQSDISDLVMGDDDTVENPLLPLMFTSEGESVADVLSSISNALQMQNKILVKLLAAHNNK